MIWCPGRTKTATLDLLDVFPSANVDGGRGSNGEKLGHHRALKP